MTSAATARVINNFIDFGYSNHSGAGGTLWALLDYLQREGVAYTLHAYPGYGYIVKRLEPWPTSEKEL